MYGVSINLEGLMRYSDANNSPSEIDKDIT